MDSVFCSLVFVPAVGIQLKILTQSVYDGFFICFVVVLWFFLLYVGLLVL